MKKKQIANLIMVFVILVIVVGGILGVGYIRGWFETSTGNTACLTQIQGTVNIERSGVNYPVENETVLRAGDKLTTNPGATAVIRRGEDTVTLGSNVELLITDLDRLQLTVSKGELFVRCKQPLQLCFMLGEVTVQDAVAALSVREGAQTLSVFKGSVGETEAGQATEYVGQTISTGSMTLERLNDFLLAQIRITNQTTALCYTDQDLDDLETKRQQAIQDLLNGQQSHTHNYAVSIVAPNCNTEGYTEYVCQCGDTYRTDETAALEHSWEAWTVVKQATAQEEGLRERKCRQCGALEQKTIEKTSENHVHSYAAEVVVPTCSAAGYTEYICQCGDTYMAEETAMLAHAWGSWIVIETATAQKEGRLKRTCPVCGMSEEKKMDKVTQDHIHSYTAEVTMPTCSTRGYTEYICQCGHTYRAAETATLPHAWGSWTVVKEATTQEEGLLKRVCTSCGAVEQKKIDKIVESHIHSYQTEVVVPTCTAEGYTSYLCSCGHSYTADIVPAKAHSYTSQVIKPTCETQGYTIYKCVCGKTYTDSATQPAGHAWGDWKLVKEATEDVEGLQERICATCAKKEEQTIAAKGDGIVGYVYIEIRCDTILNNMGNLTPGKEEFVPSNGVILPTVQVPFYENETVFEVLNRICKTANIQIEYSWTPLYGSYYIEGINHLYEFDCGVQSGWMYKVNEWFPNYGCSSYYVEDGDAIVWCYTCEGLGRDVGCDWME